METPPALNFPIGARPLAKKVETLPQVEFKSIDMKNHKFEYPSKQITKPEMIEVWLKSQTYYDMLGFIQAMGDKVKNTKISDTYNVSPVGLIIFI